MEDRILPCRCRCSSSCLTFEIKVINLTITMSKCLNFKYKLIAGRLTHTLMRLLCVKRNEYIFLAIFVVLLLQCCITVCRSMSTTAYVVCGR